MQHIIPITTGTIDGDAVPTVNLRDLHAALGVGRDFSNWVKDRIAKYGFAEGEDYVVTQSPNLAIGGGHTGGKPTIDYHASLDMAKELAMVENNDKGRAVRRYFIQVEKAMREQPEVRAEAAAPMLDQWDGDARYMNAYANLLREVRAVFRDEAAVQQVYRCLPLPQPHGITVPPARRPPVPGRDATVELDGRAMLRFLLEQPAFRRGPKGTIGSMIVRATGEEPIRTRLLDCGIAVKHPRAEDCVVITSRSPYLDRVLSCTEWAGDYLTPLLLLPGVRKEPFFSFPNSIRSRSAAVVPFKVIWGLLPQP